MWTFYYINLQSAATHYMFYWRQDWFPFAMGWNELMFFVQLLVLSQINRQSVHEFYKCIWPRPRFINHFYHILKRSCFRTFRIKVFIKINMDVPCACIPSYLQYWLFGAAEFLHSQVYVNKRNYRRHKVNFDLVNNSEVSSKMNSVNVMSIYCSICVLCTAFAV